MAIATVSAVIFLAQMLNFPVVSGTSGHLIGAAFALFALGVDGAVLSMAIVLIVQALVFGDGGFFALGANIFNMAVVGVYAADFVVKKLQVGETLKKFAAAWASVVAASVACAIQLSLSGLAPAGAVFSAMVLTHSIIGIGEGMITIAMMWILSNRLENPSWKLALGGIGISFVIAAMVLPFASQSPDGLEKIAINLGFFGKAVQVYSAPIGDYAVVGVESALAGLAAALVGTIAVFGTAYGAGMALATSKDKL